MNARQMPWRPLFDPDVPEADRARWRVKTRILVDESLGGEVAEHLRDEGYNAVYAGDVGLAGRSDEEVIAYAWRERRMLWTHDRDFLDDDLVPEHRNPGVVVLPGADGDQQAMGVGLAVAIMVFGQGPAMWSKTKTIISPRGEMTIRRRDRDTGRVQSIRYRLTRRGPGEVWEDD